MSNHRERVGLSDIFEKENIPRLAQKISTTRVGYYLAIFVFAYLGIVTAALFIDYFIHIPPKIPSTSLTADDLKNYTELSNIVLQRTQRLFEQFVEKSMLPVLTAILGYIFGVRGMDREEK